MTESTHARPDFIESGEGHTVILIHSSVAGAKQWRNLMATLENRYHLIAINLYGYGKTEPWPDGKQQTLADQAGLLDSLVPGNGRKISLVGHSFGGSVAMKAASLFKESIHRLVLIEPNPFYLLEQLNRSEAFQEAVELREIIKSNGRNGTWDIEAERFSNYWAGAGNWESMPDERKLKFVQALRPNFHEWDAVMNEGTELSEWRQDLPTGTTVISARDTVRSISEIVSLMESETPWNFVQIERGGHMAVMTQPDSINPIVEKALG